MGTRKGTSSNRRGWVARPAAVLALGGAITLIAASCTDPWPGWPPITTTTTTAPTTTTVPGGRDPILGAAGDIACAPSDADYNGGNGRNGRCLQRATSDLLTGGAVDAVVTLGDNQYETGALADYNVAYQASWGRVKSITRPVPGNHEYYTWFAAGYWDYFGAQAGPRDKGYYSYDLGSWHLIALNSEIAVNAGSEQERWLRADLAAHPNRCTLAYWHQPRFSSGAHGSNAAFQPLWQALYEAGADVVLNGHDHNYERFAPQTPSGAADPVRGIREFVAGAGGKENRGVTASAANSERVSGSGVGVLKLTLRADGYSWQYQSVAPSTFTDTGSGSCH